MCRTHEGISTLLRHIHMPSLNVNFNKYKYLTDLKSAGVVIYDKVIN